MCGIVGAVDLDGRRGFAPERLAAMGAAIAHRGPDDAHVHLEPGVALGAWRLALVDPAHGRQPITDPSGRFTAVANGELFDHRAERARLTARGAGFRTACDTEIWVHAFAHAGAAYLADARGQFAVAVWDRTERRLVLGRDRFGICPLYTVRSDGWLLFASEIKALFASGMVTPALDPRGIDHVFACLCGSPRSTSRPPATSARRRCVQPGRGDRRARRRPRRRGRAPPRRRRPGRDVSVGRRRLVALGRDGGAAPPRSDRVQRPARSARARRGRARRPDRAQPRRPPRRARRRRGDGRRAVPRRRARGRGPDPRSRRRLSAGAVARGPRPRLQGRRHRRGRRRGVRGLPVDDAAAPPRRRRDRPAARRRARARGRRSRAARSRRPAPATSTR